MATATDDAPKAPDQPPDPEFWIRHSPRFEFSISTLASITAHVVLLGMFFLIVARLMQIETPKPEVPFRSVEIADVSSDENGAGSRGSGGGSPEAADEPVLPSSAVPEPTPVELDKIKVSVSQWAPDLKDDQSLDAVATSPSRDKLEKLDPGLRNELLKGLGSKKGQGEGAGKGAGDKPGTGAGADTEQSVSRKRALGWWIHFNYHNEREYLDKLAYVKATLIFPAARQQEVRKRHRLPRPVARGETGALHARDGQRRIFIDDEYNESFWQVVAELGIDFQPRCMIAVLPREVEEELARKSTGFRNRREEDIAQTDFGFFFINGKYDIRVISQKMKGGRN